MNIRRLNPLDLQINSRRMCYKVKGNTGSRGIQIIQMASKENALLPIRLVCPL